MSYLKSIDIEIAGLGLIFCSPFATSQIKPGEDYLESNFEDPAQVEKQALEGRIVGVSTGSSGRYQLDVHLGYPTAETIAGYPFALRLGVEVRNGVLHVRDLYDLMDWSPDCPMQQTIQLQDGFYHITLLSAIPSSGIRGDNQKILVYLQRLDAMPRLKIAGVPTLC